jgi:hypothetical protein
MESEFWLWRYTDESGKRIATRYRMTEKTARERFGPDVERVEGSLELRQPLGHTSDWQKPT